MLPFEIINRPLRVGSGGEDAAFVVFQGLQPVRDVGGVIVAVVERKAKISAEKRRAAGSMASIRKRI